MKGNWIQDQVERRRHRKPENQRQVTANEVIQEIDASLVEAKASLQDLTLESATISLQTTVTGAAEGKIKFVVYVSGSREVEHVQSVTYNYEIAEKKKKPGVDALEQKTQPLAEFIKHAATEFKANNPVNGLIKGNFELEFSFSVSWDAQFGIDLLFFQEKLGLNGEVGYGNEVFHKISLTFSVKENKDKPVPA
jgi:hypothetical protein